MTRPVISLTSDFGVQTQGVGIMEGTALAIAPGVAVIHLMHGLPAFEVIAAARTFETTRYLPVGHHVCVCDPGVGTSRRALVCEVGRGDRLIGPDNGVLLPAARVLGGIRKAHEITSRRYMREPVSPIFHGRDVFVPAAAHLSNGAPIEAFGPAIDLSSLKAAPYQEAIVRDGSVAATAIQVNHFGSVHVNILHEQWDALELSEDDPVTLRLPGDVELTVPVQRMFGAVPAGHCLVLKDDYGRVEIAKNLGSFVDQYPVEVGDPVELVLRRRRTRS